MSVRIIAECGINHGGDIYTAMQMAYIAMECGANVCKFQHIDPEHFSPDLEWQGYNMRELFQRVRFTKAQLKELKAYCEDTGIGFLCTPQTVGDLEDLLSIGVTEVKISSDNLENEKLLWRVKDADVKPIISIGMADGNAYINALRILESFQPITALVCTSEYPCPPESCRMERLWSMKNQTYYVGIPNWGMIPNATGFSDHTIGNTAAIMAVALGATVIEKHFTLSHDLDGPDHAWSANPEELASYVKAIREAELMLGSGEFKPTERELETKKLLGLP